MFNTVLYRYKYPRDGSFFGKNKNIAQPFYVRRKKKEEKVKAQIQDLTAIGFYAKLTKL